MFRQHPHLARPMLPGLLPSEPNTHDTATEKLTPPTTEYIIQPIMSRMRTLACHHFVAHPTARTTYSSSPRTSKNNTRVFA
ncbi:hypothetical protein BJX68DRAFT_232780 [Aspergillus pseudodeflectus]|uniref:Uncharacterized protein n=1 Tax=Aspergillus pseudodeflectus TaxID=176178 RepID=A0ABR4KP74_9EURO